MSLSVSLTGDHPVTLSCETIDGFHRPLNGESANLTLTVRRESLWDDWLAAPPLGAACSVALDGATLLDGILAGVVVDAATLQLRVAG